MTSTKSPDSTVSSEQRSAFLMEHLAYPANPCRPYPRFPCLCLDDRSANILRVHEAEYFGLDDTLFLHHTPPHPRKCGGFLQAWLWFGTLGKVFETAGLAFRVNDFLSVESENGSTLVYLSTRQLHLYFWQWVAAQTHIGEDERRKQIHDTENCIRNVYTVLHRYAVSESLDISPRIITHAIDEYIADDEDTHVLLAITVLAEAIDTARHDIYRGYEIRSFSWQETLIVRQWLLDVGWCPNEMVWLVDQFTTSHVQTLLYLSTIDRSLLGKDHSNCSTLQCKYIKIDYKTYRPDHVKENCTCPDISLPAQDREEMYADINCGAVPLICAQDTVEGVHCVLRKRDPSNPRPIFVAISHVWSDRLGNLQDNALPACQIARLQEYVNGLYPKSESAVPFWIDTICIPRATDLRRLAINSMRTVYETAHKVLVLDKSLIQVKSTAPPEELLVHIKVATWSQRLWTFHESGLAMRLYFRFEDCSLDGDELEKRYYEISGDGPAAVHVQHFVESKENIPLSRELCRALALSDDGTNFHDLVTYEDPPQDITLDDPLAKLEKDSNHEEGDIDSQPPLSIPSSDSSSEIDWDDPDFTNNPELAAIKARIDAIESETIKMRAKTAITLEELDEVRRNTDDLDARIHLMTSGLKGYNLQQRTNSSPLIPSEWLLEPAEADLALRTKLRILAASPTIVRFWLKGFDPLFSEGFVEFTNLRTAHKRLMDELTVLPSRQQVAEAILAVRWRRTSWIEDEPICLGIILGLNVQDLQRDEKVPENYSPEERSRYLLGHRMKKLATFLGEVPRDLIFISVARLEEPGFRWMPRSFLAQGLLVNFGRPVAMRSDDGLCFEAAGFTLVLPKPLDDNARISIILNDGRMCTVTLRNGSRTIGWDSLQTYGSIAIILRRNDLEHQSSTGVVASPVVFKDQIRYVGYLGSVVVAKNHVAPVGISEALDGHALPPTQRWCLG